MLKRQFRLPAKIKFSSAQIYSSPLFQLKRVENNKNIVRVGFIVSKRIDKRAVIRNRTKRVFRSVIEDLFLRLRPGIDLLFILRKPIDARTKELDKGIGQVLEKAGLLTGVKGQV